jgi:signal transduction histidine kinase
MSRSAASLPSPSETRLTELDLDAADGTRPRSARDWLVDVGLFLLAVAGGAFGFFLSQPAHPSTQVQSIDLVLGFLACLGVFWRRRWPRGFALALVPIGLVSGASVGAECIALFNLALRRRWRTVLFVGLLYTLMEMGYWALRLPKSGPLWLDLVSELVINVVINGAFLGWGMYVRARRQLLLSLRERALRAESDQQQRVEEARRMERERIAREMHDVLAHRISLLSLHAGALEFRPDAPREEVARAAAIIRQNAHQALQDLRKVIWILRDPSSETPEPPQPTLADLPALIEDSRAAGSRVSFDNRLGDLAMVPTAIGRDGYRTVQESLTNARKHAPDCAVDLLVEGGPGSGLTIELRNRLPVGVTARTAIPGAGTGIVGLTERATLAGGRLEHGPTGDGDFRLRVWFPWTV